ncbi:MULTISPECIES: DUF6148 family protein [Paenibacillus]|uniref:DUF6148 family protein n=1 Tax=Paenibacillus TaxID=44249 RepID=UPI0022B8EE19|nr:DUF6148 family protein [Paenibacillus caseinilyticus]MCZ8520137.1 DUF6148 family protein [Paenibacillus caseinilyticus]
MAWTLETAQTHLNAWLEAELAVSAGQSYRIGTRQLERANLAEIREQLYFWRREVEQLQSGRKGGARVRRIVPRDL